MLKNSQYCYGYISIIFHWLSLLFVISLFSLGLWMVDLDYYSSWYNRAPFLHKSFGVVFFFFIIARLLWRCINATPRFEQDMSRFEQLAALTVHFMLYAFMLFLPLTGFLVATAKGHTLDVLGLFQIPVIVQVDNSGDNWSLVHEILAWVLIVLGGVHGLAALKHHFINKDNILLRMLGLKKGEEYV